MPRKPSLQTLIDHLIRESRAPFTAEDLAKKIQERWRRKISKTTLDRLKRQLTDHDCIIGTDSEDFLPCQAVLEKIGHLPLAIHLGNFEIKQKIFVPGHRMIPFLSRNWKENDVTFLDPEGNEIPKRKKTFFIEEVIHFYQYSGEYHFPGEINVNEWMPGKSSMVTTVWDMEALFRKFKCKTGDVMHMKLLDYQRGVFQLRPCPRKEMRAGLLKNRSLHLALESVLSRLCEDEAFASSSLEKQILRGFFSVEEKFLDVPAFCLTDFMESLKELTVVNCEGSVQLVPAWKSEPSRIVREESRKTPQGEKGSLEEIFQDLGLAFHEWEFISILYTVMASDKFKVEVVFYLLFGGEGKLFHDQKQHNAFYQRLRKILYQICEDLKTPESKLISDLRDKTVEVKLSLIGILRFLESQEVGLEDLPVDLLNQIIDLDHFCTETLKRFSDRGRSPDLKFFRDVRLALKIILPHLHQLEEEIYFRLGIF
ncbi:MAG: hypothetical protein ACE5E9_09870 [Nitrospinaceae bacterium]